MTREEEIKQQADTYIGHPQDLGEDISITNMRNAFITAAKWADKTMIEKACTWLLCQEEMIGISFENDFIERFKKAMEE